LGKCIVAVLCAALCRLHRVEAVIDPPPKLGVDLAVPVWVVATVRSFFAAITIRPVRGGITNVAPAGGREAAARSSR
jgi:hypothetical protein